MAEWTEITIKVPSQFTDAASDIANFCVPYGIYTEDYSDLEEAAQEIAHIDLIDEDLLKKDRSHSIIHLYISSEENPAEATAFLEERLTEAKIPYLLQRNDGLKDDWINSWKKYFKPVPVGEKLLIHPAWEEDFEDEGRIVLHLEPGVAFGSGTHETTRLCLEVLEKRVQPDCRVLDVGCGSGILSVASLLLGAKEAVGVDIDPLAVKTATENGKLNGFGPEKYTLLCGNLTEKVEGVFDVIVANIVADAIKLLSADIAKFMKPNAVYIVSGIIDTREEETNTHLSSLGLKQIERKTENGWVCTVWTK